jgi:hypothetical protein
VGQLLTSRFKFNVGWAVDIAPGKKKEQRTIALANTNSFELFMTSSLHKLVKPG